MAGTPLSALSIVGFPSGALPPEVLVEILRGAGDKAREAGIAIVGGHTIQSEEPIFGLAVVGKVHPDQVITNAGAQPGDFLVLSKPLGLGIITTAAKRGEDSRGAIVEALEVMTTLNRDAAVVIAAGEAHAMTDVTGFGLLGHLRNVTAASAVSATIWSDLVPILPAAREYVQSGIAPGGTHANRRFLSSWVNYDPQIPEWQQLLLCDAQTSGGLLAALPGTHAAEVVRHLRYHGLEARCESSVASEWANDPGRMTRQALPRVGPALIASVTEFRERSRSRARSMRVSPPGDDHCQSVASAFMVAVKEAGEQAGCEPTERRILAEVPPTG